jgi:hypothetical protein
MSVLMPFLRRKNEKQWLWTGEPVLNAGPVLKIVLLTLFWFVRGLAVRPMLSISLLAAKVIVAVVVWLVRVKTAVPVVNLENSLRQ